MPAHDDAVLAAFAAFRDDLDEHNDRRERLIKASRDITSASKKLIFFLHRAVVDADVSTTDDFAAAAAVARPQLDDIRAMFARLRDDLAGDRFWRYHAAVAPGLQEYIEALAFAHYLDRRALVPFDAVQASLSDDDDGGGGGGKPFFPLTVADYVLGLSDLTGELMRFAIFAVARPHARTRAVAADVAVFVRACAADFEALVPRIGRELARKQAVTAQSLHKIEHAAYAIAVRSSEYDLPPEMLDDLVARAVAGVDTGPRRQHHYNHRDYDARERYRDEDVEMDD